MDALSFACGYATAIVTMSFGLGHLVKTVVDIADWYQNRKVVNREEPPPCRSVRRVK